MTVAIEKLVDRKTPDAQLDIVATGLTSGSKDYFAWVKEQCSKEAKAKKDEQSPTTNSGETLSQMDGAPQSAP